MPGIMIDPRKNYTKPVDLPGDQLAPQKDFTDRIAADPALRPGLLRSLVAGANTGLNGVNNAVTFGLAPRGYELVADSTGMPVEAARKIDQAAYDIHPVAYTAGMLGGGALSAYGVAKTIGGAAVRGASALPGFIAGEGGKFAARNPWLTTLAATLGATAGLNTQHVFDKTQPGDASDPFKGTRYENFQFSQDPKVAEQQRKTLAVIGNQLKEKAGNAGAPAVLDRAAAASTPGQGTGSQYWQSLHFSDGTLRPGVTKQMEAAARPAADMEAWSMNDHLKDPSSPLMIFAPPDAAFAGGAKAAAAWQNQPGAAGEGSATTAPARSVSLDQVFSQYEAMHPDNKGGPLSDAEYKSAKQNARLAAVQRQNAEREAGYASVAKQLNTTPDVIAMLDASGGLTNKFFSDALGAQQGPPRVPRVPTVNDLAYNSANQVWQQRFLEADKLPDEKQRAEAKAALSAEYMDFLKNILGRYTLSNAQAGLYDGLDAP